VSLCVCFQIQKYIVAVRMKRYNMSCLVQNMYSLCVLRLCACVCVLYNLSSSEHVEFVCVAVVCVCVLYNLSSSQHVEFVCVAVVCVCVCVFVLYNLSSSQHVEFVCVAVGSVRVFTFVCLRVSV